LILLLSLGVRSILQVWVGSADSHHPDRQRGAADGKTR
jgi:hypothetical protein